MKPLNALIELPLGYTVFCRVTGIFPTKTGSIWTASTTTDE
jgi:hypothetical protein